MINPKQLLEEVVVPVLDKLDMNSKVARLLVMGTAAQESHLQYIRQLGNGPALGLWQMEPTTHDDIWENWIDHREQVMDVVLALAMGESDELIYNLRYAAAMCRIHYRRFPGFPTEDPVSLGGYWKKYYNTSAGRGTVDEFVENFKRVEHIF